MFQTNMKQKSTTKSFRKLILCFRLIWKHKKNMSSFIPEITKKIHPHGLVSILRFLRKWKDMSNLFCVLVFLFEMLLSLVIEVFLNKKISDSKNEKIFCSQSRVWNAAQQNNSTIKRVILSIVFMYFKILRWPYKSKVFSSWWFWKCKRFFI